MYPYHLTAIINHFPDVSENAPKGIVCDIMYAYDKDIPVPDRSVFFNKKYYDKFYANDEYVSKSESLREYSKDSDIRFM